MQHVLVKKPLYSARLAFISSIHRLLSTSLPSAQAITENSPIKSPFAAVDYLVKSCGLPVEKAINASKKISHLKSASQPDSVLQFLRESGISDACITRAVCSDPRLLCANLEKTMKPRVTAMQKIGFTPSQIARLVSLCPSTIKSITSSSLQKKIEFFTPLVGSLEGILRALKNNHYLLTVSAEKVIEGNISFLQELCGVSPNQIGKMITTSPALFTINPNRADAKIKNLKNIGFSKAEIESMIKKQPMLLTNSDERIHSSVDFLTSEAGLDLASIALNPKLICLSLERRIIPRHYVLKCLKSKGLCEKLNYPSFMDLSEKRFGDKFVSPYKDIIPEAFEAYEAARAGRISLKGKLSDAPRDVELRSCEAS